MTSRRDWARAALTRALRIRRSAGIGLGSPICPFDLAEQLGVEVWFSDISSMEAMYVCDGRPLILVGSNRPPGRQSYNCAHELGHHVFRHGSKVDQIISENGNSIGRGTQEFAANVFAGFLLMPKTTVTRGFEDRGWRPDGCTPEQAFALANWLGVSYEALITHMTWSLHLLSRNHGDQLLRVHLTEIRTRLGSPDPSSPLVFADRRWKGRAIDVQVGDFILAPSGAIIQDAITERVEHSQPAVLLRAVRPGIGQLLLADGTWSSYIRVARKGYVGRGIYRHLEDPDSDSRNATS